MIEPRKERDLEAGTRSEAGIHHLHIPCQCQAPPPYSTTSNSDDSDKTEEHRPQQASAHTCHSITTQREHFTATIFEALSVGLGLGSAVGVWACINETLKKTTSNVHLANWVAGFLMGFVLAPCLEKASRLCLAKTSSVLAKPRQQISATVRLADHIITIMSALIGLGIVKGIQMQYGLLHSNLGYEYAIFVVGFSGQAFVYTILSTIAFSREYEAETISRRWTQLPAVLLSEYLDHFRRVYSLLTINIRDSLTFAIYPYLMALWVEYWKTVDPTAMFAWVAHGLNIAFFFAFFSILKEVTYLLAIPFRC
ncbi:hypothetical protein B0H63DRAFT_466242 [Podospora didyma]|uniref:Uncharacterized protein n=1 Tax=Podospora didyma TaxID=330526 RepID=A0AAE0NZH2_9PEZI|nr:hypothetical protein B0H63DRAFT_466242 [Podospora didyma]